MQGRTEFSDCWRNAVDADRVLRVACRVVRLDFESASLRREKRRAGKNDGTPVVVGERESCGLVDDLQRQLALREWQSVEDVIIRGRRGAPFACRAASHTYGAPTAPSTPRSSRPKTHPPASPFRAAPLLPHPSASPA